MRIERQLRKKLRIADCGLRKRCDHFNPKSEIRNPKSKRRGLSLTEVLIAMGILTLGLLGVASVFPVGSFYMQKAEVADRGSAIAQSVMSDLMARGMLNPRSWYVMVPIPRDLSTTSTPNSGFASDGVYSTMPSNNLAGRFIRPFAATLDESLKANTGDPTVVTKQFGSAYVVDPLGMSFLALGLTAPGSAQPYVHGPAAVFPGAAYNASNNYATYSPSWSPWLGSGSYATGTSTGFQWPVRRVTFRQIGIGNPTQPNAGLHVDQATAERLFRGNDDLVVDLPSRDDRPAIQKWDQSSTGRPLVRQWGGDYSWIVTVAPSTNADRNAMARDPEAHAYDVSVVVFYKRTFPDNAVTTLQTLGSDNRAYLSAMAANERAVKGCAISSGLNGGELLLTDWGDFYDPAGTQKFNAFDQLRTGQWIMLCGPHPNSNVAYNGGNYKWGDSRMFLNWYQVVSIDKEGKGVTDPSTGQKFDPTTQRVVALRGAQWPWQPMPSDKTASANDLCVAICPGAVAVHTKTMRLEGRASAWSVPAGSGATDVTFDGITAQ
jgi:hypothetical protein